MLGKANKYLAESCIACRYSATAERTSDCSTTRHVDCQQAARCLCITTLFLMIGTTSAYVSGGPGDLELRPWSPNSGLLQARNLSGQVCCNCHESLPRQCSPSVFRGNCITHHNLTEICRHHKKLCACRLPPAKGCSKNLSSKEVQADHWLAAKVHHSMPPEVRKEEHNSPAERP